MDQEQCSRPVLMAKERTKYGRTDYERYDNATTDVGRAGRGKIGKVEVDCHFLFTKSRWGVIGTPEVPAGIIYMDLDFHQPSDCKLESATVAVTLATEDGEECRLQPRDRPVPDAGPRPPPVKFTQHFGPHEMRGKETLVQSRRAKKRTPQVEVMGYGVGGMGLDNEKVVQTTSRWRFSGRTTSDGGGIWDNKLQWELQENKLEREPTRANRLHTAFAFQHNASRFYMTVTVSGKLAKSPDKIKTLFHFGKRKDGKPQEMVTKIEWPDGYDCPQRLDRIAQDLRFVMELENMSAVPIELPAAQLATFGPVNSNGLTGLAVSGTQQACLPSSGSTLGLDPERPTPPAAIEWRPLQTEQALIHPAQPTLDQMSLAAAPAPLQLPPAPPRPSPPAVTRPVEQDPSQDAPASMSSSITIQIPESAQTSQTGQHQTEPPESTEPKAPTERIVPLRKPARPIPSAWLFLLWLRNVGAEFLWLLASMIPQASVAEITGKEYEYAPKPVTNMQDGKETGSKDAAVGEREQDRLRLTVPSQDTPRDLDGETCVGSSGLTPRTAFSAVEERRPWPHR
ncbi:hypothetical protein C8A05DRAFT_31770 [Staphylotrichum tortipilum]|uniref:Uncharacterized protein n=1 Tax=Staphylotrichum tortipilum TaxID=2831512 RepID=A0AAN6RVX1_9PEZI|nr:hypothetical protein C8A05DRAFT_31770 [Staphylotrichum longicolle]